MDMSSRPMMISGSDSREPMFVTLTMAARILIGA